MSLENGIEICVAIFHSANVTDIWKQQPSIEPGLFRKADHLCSTVVPNGEGFYYGLVAALPDTVRERHLYGLSNSLFLESHYSWTVDEKPTVAQSIEILENCLQLQQS